MFTSPACRKNLFDKADHDEFETRMKNLNNLKLGDNVVFIGLTDEDTVGEMGINRHGFSGANSVGCKLKKRTETDYSFYIPINAVNNISLNIYVNENKPNEVNSFFNLKFKNFVAPDFNVDDLGDFGLGDLFRNKYKKLPNQKVIKLNFNEL